MRIRVRKDGPLRVEGGVPMSRQAIVANDEGESWEWREVERLDPGETYDLCRCGRSGTQPLCDDACTRTGFDGTETAKDTPYLAQAQSFAGPDLDLTDAVRFCSLARFCDARGSIWWLVEQAGPEAQALVEREGAHCPSGRLVAWAREQAGRGAAEALEPSFEPPSIALIEDAPKGVSGAAWVRGGIPVESSDGHAYEVRNRMTLCRCGASRNKPFCDGSHVRVGFVDPSGRAARPSG